VDDFYLVIVGGGSAGCALAGRLAGRTSLRIGLVEAGPDYGPLRDQHWPAELLDAPAVMVLAADGIRAATVPGGAAVPVP
jgi:choline dehydrogenase